MNVISHSDFKENKLLSIQFCLCPSSKLFFFVTHCNIVTLPKLNYWCYNSDLKVIFYRGDIRPFIFRHNILKMPSRLIRLFFHVLTEKFIRAISSQSKGVLSSNLEVVIKKI